MKKFVKGCLILAAVCAVLGGVACVTGLVLGAGTGELQQAFRESGLKDWIWETVRIVQRNLLTGKRKAMCPRRWIVFQAKRSIL